MIIRSANINDREAIAELFRNVTINDVGISRRKHEITDTYVYALLNKKPSDIVCLVGVMPNDEIAGVILGTKNGLDLHSHILSDLTVIVKSEYQSAGYGKLMAMNFLQYIMTNRPDILRVEMESKPFPKLIQAFEKANFVKEADAINRLKNPDGTLSNSVLMAWFNPNYKP